MGVAASDPQLSPEEREALLRAARSRQTPHGVATRARLVADCADLGVSEAARRSSVSRATAAKWWHRYRAAGIDGLDDASRTGRPSASDEVIHHVLSCALDTPPPHVKRWTTRTVAEVTGVSQATVSRIRRRYFPRLEAAGGHPDLPASTLIYVEVHPSGCALGFDSVTGAPTGITPSAEARVDVMETIVCGVLMCRPIDRGTGEEADAVAVLRRAAERLPSRPAVTLVVDVELDLAAHQWLSHHPEITACSVTGAAWLGMLHRVADVVDPGQLAELRDVQRLVRDARAAGAQEFVWSRPPESAADTALAAETEPPAGDLMHVVRGICTAVSAGEVHAGGAILVRRIAELSDVSSGRASKALAQLAEEALIGKRSGRYRLPVPAPRDVIETYTARGLLGTAIVRRLASLPGPLPPAIDEHYAGLIRCDELGLLPDAGAIDLDLQDELARAAAMPRVGWMFIRLSVQLRVFLAIFGLNYRYPTDEILADDHRILVQIRNHDPDEAVEAWRSKIDNCARFMLTHLSALK